MDNVAEDERRGAEATDPDNETINDCESVSNASTSDQSEDDTGNLSAAYLHFVETAEGPFPLEKLPPEIRRMIFRFAMPDDRARPLHSLEHDWNDENDCYTSGYEVSEDESDDDSEDETHSRPYDRTRVLKRVPEIPTSLFIASRLISTEILDILYRQCYYRLDIFPFGIRARGGLTNSLEDWDTHEVLAQWRPMQHMKNFHLNVKSNAYRYFIVPDVDGAGSHRSKDPDYYEDGAERIKEWLHLVSDQLSGNCSIRNVIVTAPCMCALEEADLVPCSRSCIVDLYAPLQRIQENVNNLIQVSVHDDQDGRGMENPCLKPQCIELSEKIQKMITQPQGEHTNHREATWRDLKGRVHRAEKRRQRFPDIHWPHVDGSGIAEVWECLNGHGEEWATFEEAVKESWVRLSDFETKLDEIQAREQQVR
ncbi:MAG: hypothetical protein Q9213_001447 [Squamulea squamosa]